MSGALSSRHASRSLSSRPHARNRYTGEFKYGQEDGLGRYVWRDPDSGGDGNEWDGEWKSGEITYRGVYTRASVSMRIHASIK